MNPTDRKGKGIAIDDGDETIASIARRMRSSAHPETLLGGAIQADAAERRRRTPVDEAAAAAEAERVVERAEMEEAMRIAAEAERREEAERARQRDGEESDSGDETNSDCDDGTPPGHPDVDHEDNEGETSGQARLESIPDVIKMPSRTPSSGLIDDGRSWMTDEILQDLVVEAGFPNSVEFCIPDHHERPYTSPAGWMCVYECFFRGSTTIMWHRSYISYKT
ncbi:unnamed protein product [Microthlaspi erraticum]|uniref:Uncharacterized protein n=1 Tax=Microthlaspi erraticum TaxID=1685480 RepID=A0A6D2L4U4_9BRAS|nr:unnamed protein product [Microthlaspi erraticum]